VLGDGLMKVLALVLVVVDGLMKVLGDGLGDEAKSGPQKELKLVFVIELSVVIKPLRTV
jgi:hypothetical protein